MNVRIILKNKKLFFPVLACALIAAVFFTLKLTKNTFSINNGSTRESIVLKDTGTSKGSITGTFCANADARPLAVMMSSDPEARPLSGIGQADLVFEVPVVGDDTVTRMMAVFQCTKPERIGSVRSARLDFIPLVQGLDAIFAHFGGEHTALAKLNGGITDNVDGLLFDGTTYYRTSAPRPHNSFSNYALLATKAKELKYPVTQKINELFLHEEPGREKGAEVPPMLYSGDFAVSWTYDSEKNLYLRQRAGKPEMDKTTNSQVAVANVAVMHTTSEIISIDYNRVQTVGNGIAEIYKNGQKITGTWEKPTDTSRLIFRDAQVKEIPFTPGPIWIEIVTK